MRVPRVVQLRMLLNVAIDMVIGVVPFVGDVADVFWKSNAKNFALLERHAAEPRPATAGDWLFVAGVLVAVVVIALAPLVVVYWLVHALMVLASAGAACHLWYRRMQRVFLLSPANCGGTRAKQVLSPNARVRARGSSCGRARGAALGDVFAFVSGLYFRGKLTYACRFAAPPEPGNPIVGCGVHVITPNAGLRSPDTYVTRERRSRLRDGRRAPGQRGIPASARAERARAGARDRAGLSTSCCSAASRRRSTSTSCSTSSASGCCFRSTSSAAAT